MLDNFQAEELVARQPEAVEAGGVVDNDRNYPHVHTGGTALAEGFQEPGVVLVMLVASLDKSLIEALTKVGCLEGTYLDDMVAEPAA